MTRRIAERIADENHAAHARAVREGQLFKVAWRSSRAGGGYDFVPTMEDAIARRDAIRTNKEVKPRTAAEHDPDEEQVFLTVEVLAFANGAWGHVDDSAITFAFMYAKTREATARQEHNAQLEARRNRDARRRRR